MTALSLPHLPVSPTTEFAGVVQPLPSPAALRHDLPLSVLAQRDVHSAREEARAIVQGRDDRLLVIVGPCSIHEPGQALEYAARLAELRARLQDRLCIMMRVYIDKPRTTVGWRGYLLDPDLNGSFDLPSGLRASRELMGGYSVWVCRSPPRCSIRSWRRTWKTCWPGPPWVRAPRSRRRTAPS
ncbi:hypothetical protein [Deinococcus peraridilitoris]|uniref:hypothetical protein n=1 Tax=Deinococcus peraridilitoris TaxID=432329 RepID=UPI00031010D5